MIKQSWQEGSSVGRVKILNNRVIVKYAGDVRPLDYARDKLLGAMWGI